MTALLDHLWQSTLFALPLGALSLLLRRHAASLRFWLWFAASVKFLVPFSVLMAMGAAVTLPVVPMLPDGPALEVCFQQVDVEAVAKKPLHLDLVSPDRPAEAARLVGLGATVVETFDAHTWLRDPEGNDFCLTDR